MKLSLALVAALLASTLVAEPIEKRFDDEEYENCELRPTITAMYSSRHSISIFGNAVDQNLYWATNDAGKGQFPSFSAWASLGGPVGSEASVATHVDGRLIILMRGQDRKLYVKEEKRGEVGFTAWHGIDVKATSAPLVRMNEHGIVEIYYRDRTGALKVAYQQEPNSDVYTDWFNVVTADHEDTKALELPLFATTPQGVMVLIVNIKGHLLTGWHDEKERSFSTAFAVDRTLAVKGKAAVAVASDGRIQVFARADGTDRLHYRHTRTAGSAEWTPWFDLGGKILGSPRALTLSDGRTAVIALSFDGVVRVRTSDWEKGWGEWRSLIVGKALVGIESGPAVVVDKDGFIHVFGLAKNGRVLECIGKPDASAWGEWRDIGTYLQD